MQVNVLSIDEIAHLPSRNADAAGGIGGLAEAYSIFVVHNIIIRVRDCDSGVISLRSERKLKEDEKQGSTESFNVADMLDYLILAPFELIATKDKKKQELLSKKLVLVEKPPRCVVGDLRVFLLFVSFRRIKHKNSKRLSCLMINLIVR
jgi:hypothetical protein